MKKIIIILFVLMPFASFAKFYKATVTMNDHSIKNGFVELPEYPDDAKIKFRVEEKGKNEKLDVNDVKGFELINDKNETVRYCTIYLGNLKVFNMSETRVDKKKSWVKILKEGKISLYSAYYSYSAASKTGGGSSYYIKRANEDFALYLTDGGGGNGFNVNMNGFSDLKRTLKYLFDKECPKLVDLLKKEDLQKNGISFIVDLYEQNCGK